MWGFNCTKCGTFRLTHHDWAPLCQECDWYSQITVGDRRKANEHADQARHEHIPGPSHGRRV